jgi:hypothetical protein
MTGSVQDYPAAYKRISVGILFGFSVVAATSHSGA